MKDEDIKFEEIESSLTLGGSRRCYAGVIQTLIHQSRVRRHTIPGWVVITDAPVYRRERGGGGRDRCVLRIAICTVPPRMSEASQFQKF